jgi:hypothetical protein
MDRREMMGVLGAAGLATLGVHEAGAQHEGHRDKVHEDCLKACQECAEECSETFHHCFKLVEQGKKEHARAAHLALDCAEFCGLSACLITRESELMGESCEACADACKKCGDECAKFDSEKMKECVEACRKCERSCRAMVKAMRSR